MKMKQQIIVSFGKHFQFLENSYLSKVAIKFRKINSVCGKLIKQIYLS